MQDMKKMMAQKLLQKLGSINPTDIEAITIQLVMKDGGVDMPEKDEDMFEEEKEEEEPTEEGSSEKEGSEEYSMNELPDAQKKREETPQDLQERKKQAFKKMM